MKAKDYIEQFHDQEGIVGEKKAICDVLLAMLEEIQVIGKARKIQTDDAFWAIVKEQEGKWKAMCGLDERLRPEGFREGFDLYFPMFKGKIWIPRTRGGR